MKKFICIALMTAFASFLTACVQLNVGMDVITGSGPMVSQDFDVGSFNSINVTGNFIIIWRESPDAAVTIDAQQNILDNFNVTVRGNVLHVGAQRGHMVTGDYTPRLYIYTPYIAGITTSGSATASDWDTVRVQEFSVNVSGAADMSLDFDVESIDIRISGSASIDFIGNISSAIINLSGAGSIDISVIDYLDVDLSGAVHVRYRGSPTVTSRISGVGTVRQVN